MEMTFRFGKMSLFVRLFLFAILELAGIALHVGLILRGGSTLMPFVLTYILMIAGLVPLAAKAYTNKPQDLGFEDWQPASDAEVRRIAANFRLTREAKLPAVFRPGFGIAVAAMLFVFAGIALFLFENVPAALFFVSAVVILWPVLFFGGVSLFVPHELKMKLDTFRPVLDAGRPDSLLLTPYLRLDKDKEGRRIPEDIRFMLEPKRKPEDFLGVQFQVSINNGKNGRVPYMYAVFITKGAGKTYKKFSSWNFRGFVMEKSPDGEYATVVVRQPTSGDGYHTKADDCLRLHDVVVEALTSAV